jgi:hypothetical protein
MTQPATVRVVALTAEQQQAFDRAKARVAQEAIEIDRIYFDQAFQFRFLPAMSMPAIEVVGRVQGLAKDNNVSELFSSISSFMELMSLGTTAELWDKRASCRYKT